MKFFKYYKHYIAIAITLCFIACSVFIFPNAFIRVKESCIDLWQSVKFYFNELLFFTDSVEVSVTNLSNVEFKSLFNFPKSWEEFQTSLSAFWQVFINQDNLSAYLDYLGELMFNISQVLLLIGVPVVFLFIIIFKRYTSTVNNDYNKDSKALTLFKAFEIKVICPIKNWFVCFVSFLKENSYYFKIWLLIWLFNFNFISIALEFLAYYFYFVMSLDVQGIFIQIYKLLADLSVCLLFVPLPIWVVICLLILYFWGRHIGYNRLEHMEHKNCGFINSLPIVTMVCGSMGKKKTTIITDMALSQEVMFKSKAFDKLLESDMKFPYFPWINLENCIKKAMSSHIIYNLASCRKYIQELKYYFEISFMLDKSSIKSIRKYVNKKYGFRFNNLIFDYDYKRYGLTFNDNLKVVDVWKVIEDYSQLYFVYIIQSSLTLSNYSIRTDNYFIDLGNFPYWNTDFFHKDSSLVDSTSRHSHVVDFDALRLGKKLLEDNEFKDSFDFGVVNLTEIGKERKNNLELKELKKTEDLTNQKNDGFNDWLKMVRHSATIDNYPFVKVITDEQRPESWGADARDLCELVHIKDTSEDRLAMPFFSAFELLYAFVSSKFVNTYYTMRHNRGDNTLFLYLLKKITSSIYNFYHRIYNTFGYTQVNIKLENGIQDGAFEDKEYYLMFKKIYSKRFSTDCFSDFFAEKSLRSNFGINDLPEYRTEKASIEELAKQNSYFITELINKNKEIKNEDDKKE